jgi:hypothetical protein
MLGSKQVGGKAGARKFAEFRAGEARVGFDFVDALERGALGVEVSEYGGENGWGFGLWGFDDEEQAVFASGVRFGDDGEGGEGEGEELGEALFEGFDGDEFAKNFDHVVIAGEKLEEGASAIDAQSYLVGGLESGGWVDGFPNGF